VDANANGAAHVLSIHKTKVSEAPYSKLLGEDKVTLHLVKKEAFVMPDCSSLKST